MITIRHSKKMFCKIYYAVTEENYKGKGCYEFECSDEGIEKARQQVQLAFDNQYLTLFDYNDIIKTLDMELDELE